MPVKRLKAGQPTLTAWEKSAEGIVAGGNEPRKKRGGLTPGKGLNGAWAEWSG